MTAPCTLRDAETVLVNLHRSYAGVAATMRALLPAQQAIQPTAIIDRAKMGLPGTIPLSQVMRYGWTRPPSGLRRVWHARRAPEQIVGLILKHILRQPWTIIYTSPSPRRHGWIWRTAVGRADAIVSVTRHSASFLERCDAVIPHGVDTSEFVPTQDREAAWREGGLPGRFGIGIFGRVRPSKGTDLFVEAMCATLPRHPEYTAIITGLTKPSDATFRERLIQRIRNAQLEDRIIFLGDLDFPEIKRWYQRISLCVAIPRSEGFGLTPLEAMASGAPALTSSEGCFPDLIKDGVNGMRVPTGDLDAVIEALDTLLEDPIRLAQMGRSAREIVLRQWSITNEAAALQTLYDKVRIA